MIKATFTISSTEDLGTGFKFNYQVSQTGDFLTSSTTLDTLIPATEDFTQDGSDYTTTLEFDIEDDSNKEQTGLVTVTLLASDGTTGNYTLPATPSASVTVYDDEVPALEIAGSGAVTEGPNAKAQFDVTARFNVAGAILFRYQPDDGVGSFLTGNTAGNPQIGRLNFNGTDTASFEVPIYDDAVAEENGTVTAELLNENGGIFNYTVAPAPDNIGSVAVNDNDALPSGVIQSVTLHTEPIPTISQIGIANVDYYVSVETAVTKDLEIVYEYIYGLSSNPISGGGTSPGFDPNTASNWTRGTVTILAGDTTGQFTIPVQTFFGTNITVRLVDGANYNPGNPSQQNLPTQTATATDPLVSIDVVGDRRILEIPDVVYQRDRDGNLIRDPQTGAVMVDTSHTKFKTKFIVSATPSPARGSSIPVDVSFTQANVNIVGESSNTFTRRVILSNQQTTAEIEFELEVNDLAGGHGNITAIVPDGTDYQVGSYSNTASVSIIDDESLPVLTINDPDSVSESDGSVTFKITSNAQPTSDSLRVHYGLREPTGDFLVTNTIVFPDSQLINFTPVAGSTTDYEGNLVIPLDNDEVAETNGSVSVTLVSDTNFTYHVVTGTNDVGVVQITDDDTPALALPVISISSAAEANGVTEEYSFTFEIESDIDLGGTPLDIAFTVSDGGTGAIITGTTVRIEGNQRRATGTVTNISDISSATNIVIAIADGVNYNVDTNDPSITVAVKDNDATSAAEPSVKISGPNYVAEGDTIEFTVTASEQPNNETTVNVLFEVQGDFIGASETNNSTKPAVIANTGTTGTVSFVTKADVTDGVDGLISATILDGTDYVRSNTATENETSAVILDALPVISVSAPTVVDETDDATSTFDVTLTIETADFVPLAGRPLVIDGLTIANVSDSLFQDYYQSHVTDIEFTDANDSTDRDITVAVTISGDDVYRAWGEISIALASGDEYTADPNNNSATVSVREDETSDISVAIEVSNSVVGGEDIDATLVATNTSGLDVNGLMVDFQVENVTGTYLNYTNAMVTIDATSGVTRKQVLIPTTAVPEGSTGTISLVVNRGNGYETASITPVNVTVTPPIPVPVLTVSAGPAVDEGSTNAQGDLIKATFTISSTEDLGTGFKFNYQVSQTGDFLTSSTTLDTLIPATEDFTQDGSDYTTTLEFDIEDDSNKEQTGLVTVTLLASDGTTGNYTLPATPSASVTVYDDEVPALEIAGSGAVTEGPNAKAQFDVTARFNVAGAILFRYQPDDGFGSFLTGNIAGNPQIGRLNFNGTDTASFTVPIYDDAVAEENGTVTAELLNENGGIFNYTVAPAPDNIGSVAVSDNDALPSGVIQSVTLHTEPIPSISQIGIANVDYYVSVANAVTKDLEVVYEYIYGLSSNPISGGGTSPGFDPATDSNWTRGTVTILAGDTTGQFTIPVQTFFGTNITVRLVDGANYNPGNPSQQNLPTQTATATDPLVSIDVVGDRRILEIPDVVYLRDQDGNLIRDPQTGAVMIDTSHTKFKAKFVVSAIPSPASGGSIPVDVSFTTTNVSIDGENSNTFTRRVILSNQQTSAEIEFELDTNTSADGHGNITAVVPDGTGYQVGSYSNSASVSIIDDESLPVLTINNPTTVSESAGSVTFKITSNAQPTGDSLRVHYGLREPTGDFLLFQAPSYLTPEQRVLPASQLLNFTEVAGSPGTYEANLVIELDDDEVAESSGSVSVTLVSDANFTYHVVAGTNDVGTVQVTDDDTVAPVGPKLSISSGAVDTGVTERYSYVFTVTSDNPITGSDLDVTLAITDGAGNNLDILRGGGNTIKIRVGKDSATGVIDVGSRVTDPASKGQINVAIMAIPGSYQVDSDNDDFTVVVKDSDIGDETTPVVSISGPSVVVEGRTARFEVSASHTPGTPPLDVELLVANTRGNFLAAGQAGTRSLQISTSDTPASFDVSTVVDSSTGTNGSFNVSIVEKSGYALPRGINNGSLATSIIDPPAISITGGGAVDEGSSANFTLSSTNSSIISNVRVQLSDGDGGFLSAAQKTIREIPVGLFHRISESTLSNSSTFTDGVITATILDDDNTPPTYTVGSPNPAMVTINNTTIRLPDTRIASLNRDIETSGVTRGHGFEIKVELDAVTSSAIDVYFTVRNVNNKAPRIVSNDGFVSTLRGYITIPANKRIATRIVGVESNFTGDVPSDAVYQVNLVNGSGYTNKSDQRTINIPVRDNSAPTAARPVVSIASADSTAVVEGNNLTFTVKATPAPTSDLDVTVNVATDNVLFFESSQLFERKVTIPGGSEMTTLPVTTQNAAGFATVWASVVQADGYILPIVETDLSSRTITGGHENEKVLASAIVEDSLTVELSTEVDVVTEGNSFKVRITPSTTPSVTVPVKISITETGNFVRPVSLNQTSVDLEVAAYTEFFVYATYLNDHVDSDSVVTIEVMDGSGYQLGGDTSEDVTIQENSGVLAFVLEANSETIKRGESAVFKVTSNLSTDTSRGFRVDFITDPVDLITNKGSQTATINANSKESHGIVIRIPTDTDTDYDQLSSITAVTGYFNRSTQTQVIIRKTINVVDDDIPTGTSIISVADSIFEGETAEFIVTTSNVTSSDREFTITVTDGGANKIDTSSANYPYSKVVIPANSNLAALSIPTLANDAVADATLTVTLSAPDLNSTYSSARVVVLDANIPTVSLVENRIGLNELTTGTFKIRSDRTSLVDLPINLEIVSIQTNPFTLTPDPIAIPANATELSVSIESLIDETVDISHYIQIGASADGSYKVGGNNFLRIVVFDTSTDPEVSISAVQSSVTEGQPARFTISLNPAERFDIPTRAAVRVEFDNVGGNPFGSDQSVDPEKFTRGFDVRGSSTIEIPTRAANNITESASSVKATIIAGPLGESYSYQIAAAPNNSAMVAVVDETRPIISIAAPAEGVVEGASLTFPVTVTNPSSSVRFRYRVTETGNFVAPASLAKETLFADGRDITINTKAAADDLDPNSIVTVELLPAQVGFNSDGTIAQPASYILGATASASSEIRDKDVPTSGLSLLAYENNILETEDVRFQIRTATPLANDATVKVRIENGNNRERLIDRNETIDVVLPAGQRSVDFSVETQATWGIYRTQTTQFTATLRLNGGQYTLATGNENISQTITASNIFSTVTASVAVDKTVVTEGDGQLIQFAITVARDDETKEFPSAEIAVDHVIRQTGGNFIYTSESSRDSATGTKRITFNAEGTKNILMLTQVDAGNSSGSISLEIVTNTFQNYYAVAASPNNAKTVTVNDNGQISSQLSLSAANIANSEIPVTTVGEGDVWGVKITIDPPASYPLRIALSAIASGDFLDGSSVRVIEVPSGFSNAPLFGAIATDDIAEPDGTLTISIIDRPSYTIDSNNNEVVYTFKDNDQIPTLSFTSQTVVVDENVQAASGDTHGKMVFGVELSHASVAPVVVNYAVASTGLTNPATNSTDYQSGETSITIPAGETMGTIEIEIINDGNAESNENLTLTITRQDDALYQLAGDASSISAQGTIVDDDTATPIPVVSINNVEVEEDVDPAVMTFTVALSGPATGAVDLTYETSDGTATAGSDYTAIPSTPLSITAGQTSEEIMVTISDDDIDEHHETFNLVLNLPTSTTNAEFVGSARSLTAIGTIRDDDRKPMLEFQDTAVAIHEGAGTMNFVVNVVDPDTGQSITSERDISVPYSVRNVTTVDSDYTLSDPAILNIPAGSRSGTISVTLTDDADNTDESFTLILARPINAILGVQSHQVATGTITNFPSDLQQFSVVGLQSAITEGTDSTNPTTAAITVQLDNGATAASQITVDYTLTGDGETNVPSDVKLASNAPGRISDSAGTLTLEIGESFDTIPLEIIADAYDEGNDRFTIMLSNASSGTSIGMASTTETITDDDAEPTVAIAQTASVMERDTDITATIAVTLSAVSGRMVTVPFIITGTATANDDFVIAESSVIFATDANTTITPMTRDITFTIKGDDNVEPAETIIITLGTPTNASIVGQNVTGTVTITDDDAPVIIPTISFADRDLHIGEGSGTLSIPVTLSEPASTYPVQLDWSIIPVTANANNYSIASGNQSPLVINSGTTGNIVINITDDQRAEGNEVFQVRFDRDTIQNATIEGPHRVTVTIWDDESLQTYSISAIEAQAESYGVQFRVEADKAPVVDVPLTINVSQVGDFIKTPAAGSSALGAGTNTVIFGANQQIEYYVVNTKAAGTAAADGSISATLQSSFTSNVNSNADSASVTIWDVDRPRATIESITTLGVEEGNPARFKVSVAPFPTTNTFDVNVDVSQIVYEGASFIDTTDTMNGVIGMRTVSLTPKTRLDPDGNAQTYEYSVEFDVATDSDDDFELSGQIVASIVASSTYNINPLPNYASAIVSVRDNDGPKTPSDLPMISIAPASTTPVAEGGSVTFELKATDELRVAKPVATAYNIDIGLSNSGGNFLDTTASGITSTPITFTTVDADGNSVNRTITQTTTVVEMPANQNTVRFSVPNNTG